MSLTRRRWPRVTAMLIFVVLSASACGLFSSPKTILIRSDMPTQGMQEQISYVLTANPDDTSETNVSQLTGMNGASPTPMTTTFGKGAGARTEIVQIAGTDGSMHNVLSMTKQTVGFGLTRSLVASLATYQMRDVKGDQVCGAKVELDFQPSFLQLFSTRGQGWDAVFLYNVPCPASDPTGSLDIAHATLDGLIISQQTVLRITGKPIFMNRGRSVTVVGGPPAALRPGWWEVNALPHSNNSILGAADMVRSMVSDLNTSPTPWLGFNPNGRFASSQLVMSTGDADQYNLKRIFLNRQSDYMVYFRSAPTDPWHSIDVHPIYNYVWNDWSSLFAAVNGFNPLNVDSKIGADGYPKDPNDPVLKEIERNGCQNCANAELSQIQFRDGNSGRVLYAITLRAYYGANSTLIMYGKVPQALNSLEAQASAQRKSEGVNTCPVQYSNTGNVDVADPCVDLLREGAMWNLITENPQSFGMDEVGQFEVRDNSQWANQCSGSGQDTTCTLVPQNRQLNADYMFDNPDATAAWDMTQLEGPVGMDTLGSGYTSGPGTGDGMAFALAQSVVKWDYFHGITDPAVVFALDGPDQLPSVLASAWTAMQNNN